MLKTKMVTNVPHAMPRDLSNALKAAPKKIQASWDDITPLARNEFICWVISAKQTETRDRRVSRTIEELGEGKRRPCCWAGCIHRVRNGK